MAGNGSENKDGRPAEVVELHEEMSNERWREIAARNAEQADTYQAERIATNTKAGALKNQPENRPRLDPADSARIASLIGYNESDAERSSPSAR